MRRTLVLAALLAAPLAFAAPADAAPPNSGCAVGWDLFGVDWVPPLTAALEAVDKANPDRFVCTKNNAKGAMFVDNTSAATSGWSG